MAKQKKERWYVVTYREMSHTYKTPVKALNPAEAKWAVIGTSKTKKKVSVRLMK